MRDRPMLFSLQGLLALEKERERAEAAERGRILAEERGERERSLLEVGWRRERAEVEARRQAELCAREQSARLDALRLAAIERARVEAEAAARLEELERRHAHEQALRAVTESSKAKSARRLAFALLGLWLLSAVGVAGLYLGKVEPETERLQQAYEKLVTAERARAEETKRLLGQANRDRAALRAELERLRATRE